VTSAAALAHMRIVAEYAAELLVQLAFRVLSGPGSVAWLRAGTRRQGSPAKPTVDPGSCSAVFAGMKSPLLLAVFCHVG
jgi:hypothetical protein